MKLLYSDLDKNNVERIAKIIFKFNWEDENTYKFLLKKFVQCYKVKYSNLNLLAYIAVEQARVNPKFGVNLIDAITEDIRIGLEQNLFRHNQRRVSQAKYLAELYNFKLINHNLVFTVLYFIINFGYGKIILLIYQV
jgi:regulator of nonsense transcripts 2